MHFTGTIWRPPFEANDALLQVTAGCTHHNCKFCTLYEDVKFRMSPMEEIIEDLEEIRQGYHHAERVYLTGANPFVLSFDKLKAIALKVKEYLPNTKSIGCFSRVTDFKNKTDEQLKELRELGYDGLNIGVESGYEPILKFMRKGYGSSEIVEQCKRLDSVGISYNFFYLTGLAGDGKGIESALASAEVFNQLRPRILIVTALTIFPEADLYQDIQSGDYKVAGEFEKLHELKTLYQNLNIEIIIMADTISNVAPMRGVLPRDKDRMVSHLQKIINQSDERELERYRDSIYHL